MKTWLYVLVSYGSVVSLTQYPTALFRSNSSPLVLAGDEHDAANEAPRENASLGTGLHRDFCTFSHFTSVI